MKTCSAILLAAGSSRRLGFDKILTPLAGRPVLCYSLQALKESPSILEIILVTREDIRDRVGELVRETPGDNPVHVILGGVERQDSVFEGLRKISDGTGEVLIHDAARPLLAEDLIEGVLSMAREKGAAVTAHRASDTLKQADEQARVLQTLDRSNIWAMGTPQVFRRDLICEAYAKVQAAGVPVTDDAAAVERLGHPVYLAESGRLNLKITRPSDWEILELWLKRERGGEIRGMIHRLSNQLSPLIGYLPLLEKYGGENPRFADYLEKMKQSSDILQNMVYELQAVARDIFPDGPSNKPGREKNPD
ncbi:MAG: 2-C-methyl-D-erythritol 4-phosphate cytidylyltransferase [Methylacidiphilales bacterium]|nr:2-C-methyl-D-erythritol 4-phosphate cytidylyltransferase [Candidatus Methylacidiphilales bacterium]